MSSILFRGLLYEQEEEPIEENQEEEPIEDENNIEEDNIDPEEDLENKSTELIYAYQLKKIYTKLLALNEIIEPFSSEDFIEHKDVLIDSLEILHIIINNMTIFINDMDNIIDTYNNIIKELSTEIGNLIDKQDENPKSRRRKINVLN